MRVVLRVRKVIWVLRVRKVIEVIWGLRGPKVPKVIRDLKAQLHQQAKSKKIII
jgi:hypothetical protein